MTQSLAAEQPSKGSLWAGRVLSGLATLMLVGSAGMKLSHGAELVQQFTGKFGYPEASLMPIGVVELILAILYAVPATSRTAVVLLTAYLGGAVATHVRAGEPFFAPIVVGVVLWLGLYLRDRRLGFLLPGNR